MLPRLGMHAGVVCDRSITGVCDARSNSLRFALAELAAEAGRPYGDYALLQIRNDKPANYAQLTSFA
jgi:hypothetical protein